MIIAVIMLVIICGILLYQLSQKRQADEEIIKQNKQLELHKKEIEKDIEWLNKQTIEYKEQIEHQKQELQERIEQSNRLIEEDKKISEQAMELYLQTLEEAYDEAEMVFDIKIFNKHKDLLEVQQELDKLKETRAAAHEALLKEQEIKENKDNYRLIPSELDLADSRKLELIKRDLNKPRILCMLIWQTYWQPLAKKQFPIIIQAKTKCGIYKITNLLTNDCYIGQSVDIYKRWCEHCKCGLGIDTPPGNKLYKAIQECGLENFTFEVIEECPQSDLNEKEKYFINLYQADVYGYNGNIGVSR